MLRKTLGWDAGKPAWITPTSIIILGSGLSVWHAIVAEGRLWEKGAFPILLLSLMMMIIGTIVGLIIPLVIWWQDRPLLTARIYASIPFIAKYMFFVLAGISFCGLLMVAIDLGYNPNAQTDLDTWGQTALMCFMGGGGFAYLSLLLWIGTGWEFNLPTSQAVTIDNFHDESAFGDATLATREGIQRAMRGQNIPDAPHFEE